MNKLNARPLWAGFVESVERFADRPALSIANRPVSYAELANLAQSWAATMGVEPTSQGGLTAIYANHSLTAYAGVLATLMRGHGYVPLNPEFPASRLADMIQISGVRSIIVGDLEQQKLAAVLAEISEPMTILVPDQDLDESPLAALAQHRLLSSAALEPATSWTPPAADLEALAYVLFTSGSTGRPKAVGVTHNNVQALIHSILSIYDVDEHDRYSQLADLTFDASVHDMFFAWDTGGCVCCPSFRQLVDRGRFIKTAKITVFTSAPSFASAMRGRGELVAGAFPDLKISVFGADGLPVELAKAWQLAAPNSSVYNFYGPTEVTVNSVVYRWDSETSEAESEIGFVPIGYPVAEVGALVVDENLNEVQPGERGELVLTGAQVTRGYLNNAEQTAKVFIELPGQTGVCYRTGDLVRRPAEASQPYKMFGRIDNQVQIAGARVELGEIESAIRGHCGIDAVVAVPWPLIDGIASAIEVFVEARELDVEQLMAETQSLLAPFSRPKRINLLDEMPLNVNGKYDRNALKALLEKRDLN